MKNKDFFMLSSEQTLKILQTSQNGLTSGEAERRQKKCGLNIVVEEKKKSKLKMLAKQFTDIMIIILILSATLSISLAIFQGRPTELVDGFIIIGIVILNAVIGFIQELKAEKSTANLKKLTEPESKVMRDGQVLKVNSKNLVVGDIILLEAGDIIPADCRLLKTVMLKCDESSLTGESGVVEKDGDVICGVNTILAERKNMAYFGSVVVNGHGVAVVVATGKQTQIGKLAKIITSSQKDQTPLQKGIKQVGQVITFIILGVCLISFIVQLLWSNISPLEAFLTAVALAVAGIPESLPAVITIILSLGVSKLAKRKAIVKNLQAVETLGSCSVICSDKTGTITQNKMTVREVYCNNSFDPDVNSVEFANLLYAMALCNNCQITKNGYSGDSTEVALCEYASRFNFSKGSLEKQLKRIREIPFSSERKLMTCVYNLNDKKVVFSKGAVDVLINKCKYIKINNNNIELTGGMRQKILQANKKMASSALRVLAFAIKDCDVGDEENNLVFVGLCGMIDPPRKEVKKAIEKCKKGGILPIMITGDHKDTAFAVAKEVGLASSVNQVLTGRELDALSEDDFIKILPNITVFARVSPENKVRIVDTIKRTNKIVAMTGDGVNDAPSIKKAHIGIGMGITGTDVTKEVADIIIADDNFATIVVAVEQGRKIYNNIQKTITFLFSANLAELLTIFLATIMFPATALLTPVQILFVNLISDTFPAIALGLEKADRDIMNGNPRKANASIFSDGVWKNIVFMGIIQCVMILVCFLFGKFVFQDDLIASTMAFYALNIIQFFYFASMRTKQGVFENTIFKNKWAALAVATCFGFMALIALTPLHGLLGLVDLSLVHWVVITASGVIVMMINELFKKDVR